MDTKKYISVKSIGRVSGKDFPFRMVPVFRGMGIISATGEYSYPLHVHSSYEVILIDKGDYRCLVNADELSLGPGEVLVVKPGDSHRDFCKPPLKYFGLSFNFDSNFFIGNEKPSLFTPDCPISFQITKIAEASYSPIMRRIEEESELGDAISSHVQDAILLEFFWLLVRNLPKEGISKCFADTTAEQSFVMMLKRFFHSNITGNPAVSEMARHMGMSESSLAHKCTEIMGVSPSKAFMRYKMEHAARMLKHSDMGVKEIAAYFGFDNPYNFSRAFKNTFGKSPSQMR